MGGKAQRTAEVYANPAASCTFSAVSVKAQIRPAWHGPPEASDLSERGNGGSRSARRVGCAAQSQARGREGLEAVSDPIRNPSRPRPNGEKNFTSIEANGRWRDSAKITG